MTSYKPFFNRFLEAVGIHQTESYVEDVGKEQTRILNEFSSVGEEIGELYHEITEKRLHDVHKAHALKDVIQYFKEIQKPLSLLERYANELDEADEKTQTKLIKTSRAKYQVIQKRLNQIHAHLLDLNHPNTNLKGYNAIFDMWRYIDRRINSPDIQRMVAVTKNLDRFHKEIELVRSDIERYGLEEKEVMALDQSFLKMLFHLRKTFFSLTESYNEIISTSVDKEDLSSFMHTLQYVMTYVSRLRYQEEELFIADDTFMSPFEKHHKKVTFHLIESLEKDLEEFLHQLQKFVQTHINDRLVV